jgi:hypothetical protein
MEVTRTARGFEIVRFADIYGEPCTLQESSLGDRHAIWLGAGDNRAHIDAKLFEQLLPHINRMLDRHTATAEALEAMREARYALEAGVDVGLTDDPDVMVTDAQNVEQMEAALTRLTAAIAKIEGEQP